MLVAKKRLWCSVFAKKSIRPRVLQYGAFRSLCNWAAVKRLLAAQKETSHNKAVNVKIKTPLASWRISKVQKDFRIAKNLSFQCFLSFSAFELNEEV
jgi:hypothetical protein